MPGYLRRVHQSGFSASAHADANGKAHPLPRCVSGRHDPLATALIGHEDQASQHNQPQAINAETGIAIRVESATPEAFVSHDCA